MKVCVWRDSPSPCDSGGWTSRQLCREHLDLAADLGLLHLYPTEAERRQQKRSNGIPRSVVCECAEPNADPKIDFGMCQRCGRKPVSLMKDQA